jgi:hypothetical protein
MTATAGLVRVPPPGTLGQVRAVLAMRSAAIRGSRRRQVTVALVAIPAVAVLAAVAGTGLPAEGGENVLILLPALWLGFGVTTTVAAATGGGRVLLPPHQRAPFPVSPAADHLGTLLLAPLNIAWLVQGVGLVLAGSWSAGPRLGVVLAIQAVTAAWIVTVTVAGQAVGELVELVRTTRRGSWYLRGFLAALVAGLAGLTAAGGLVPALDQAPTRRLVVVALQAGNGEWVGFAAVLAGLAAATAAAYVAGARLVAVVRRRPARSQVRVEATEYPARPDPRSELAGALRIDHASVWRSAPLRRGLLALPIAPALAAAVAHLDWSLIVLLPGLVTSGAALLFGVNAMSLDGSGAVWRASLPGSPRILFVARLLVLAEVSLIASVGAVLVAVVRAPAPPTAAQLTAVVVAALATTAQVAGHCAHWTVHRPYAATLRDSRDQPAPPAAMAAYSARLAVVTTGTGLLLSALTRLEQPGAVAAVAVAIGALGCRRVVAALDRWDDPVVRARVVATVAGG